MTSNERITRVKDDKTNAYRSKSSEWRNKRNAINGLFRVKINGLFRVKKGALNVLQESRLTQYAHC